MALAPQTVVVQRQPATGSRDHPRAWTQGAPQHVVGDSGHTLEVHPAAGLPLGLKPRRRRREAVVRGHERRPAAGPHGGVQACQEGGHSSIDPQRSVLGFPTEGPERSGHGGQGTKAHQQQVRDFVSAQLPLPDGLERAGEHQLVWEGRGGERAPPRAGAVGFAAQQRVGEADPHAPGPALSGPGVGHRVVVAEGDQRCPLFGRRPRGPGGAPARRAGPSGRERAQTRP